MIIRKTCIISLLLIELWPLILTHRGRVMQIFTISIGHHWYRWWLFACSAPSHYLHDDVIKWKHFRLTGPLCGEFTGQWRGALMFSLICVWINGWVNNCEAGDLRRHRGHYDVNVINSAGLQLIGPLRITSSGIGIKIQLFTFKKYHLQMSSINLLPFCLGLNIFFIIRHVAGSHTLKESNHVMP